MTSKADFLAHRQGSDNRRPIATRESTLARVLSRALLKTPITPNQISLLGVVFAGVGAVALILGWTRPTLYLVAMAAIQLRLLCNLLDGLVAIEGGRGSPLGALYNELPDRVADSLLIVCLGYAAGVPWLGWAAALAAALTAYLRAFGGALGQKQDFRGPMAKQHRMGVMTLACPLALIEAWIVPPWLAPRGLVLTVAASVILVGSLVTCVTRTRAIAKGINCSEVGQ